LLRSHWHTLTAIGLPAFVVLKAVTIFLDVTPYNTAEVYRRFGEIYYFLLQQLFLIVGCLLGLILDSEEGNVDLLLPDYAASSQNIILCPSMPN
jgi:hypothetical protein